MKPKILFAVPVEDDASSNTVPARKWLHVASEGDFGGHADGEFSLDRSVFDSFVRNFRSDPRYDGGRSPVLPFDFEHASELAATNGSIPTSGAPAPAWALELDVRTGPNGEAQLWALAQLGELIRGYIASDEYRHVSIAFSLDATDAASGRSIGPALTSIAFTNHPFLRGLASLQIAASSRGRSSATPARIMFAAGVALAAPGNAETEDERTPIDLQGLPLGDLTAAGAVDAVVEYLAKLDPQFAALPEDQRKAFAQASLDLTLERRAERAETESSSAQQRANTMGSNNSLRLTAAEVALCDAAPNATAAAIAVLSARDPRGYGLRPDAHRKKTRELADQLRAWATTLPLSSVAPTGFARSLTAADRSSSAVLDLRLAAGRNRTERAMSALALEDEKFEGQPLERRIALASQALRTRRVLEDETEETRALAAQGESGVPAQAKPIGQWPTADLPSLAELRAYPGARGIDTDVARAISWMIAQTSGAFGHNSWGEQCRQATALVRSIYAREPLPQPQLRAGGAR